ncbi:MAG: radical SAM protein [Chloroflexota bacterium]
MKQRETEFLIIRADDVESHRGNGLIPMMDSDCACPTTNSTLSLEQSSIQESYWQRASQLHRQELKDNNTLVFNPFSTTGPLVLNHEAHRLLTCFEQPRSLDDAQIERVFEIDTHQAVARLVELGLIEPVGSQPAINRGTPDCLVAWLHTTNACNLRCTYCYIDKSAEPMNDTVGFASVDAVFRSAQQHGFPAVKLKYAGGEATLNFGLVQKLHTYAQGLAGQTGIQLHEVVLSNGVALTNRMLTFMQTAGIGLSISLDGLGEGHDAQRVFVNGKGSAMHVKRSVERALAHGVRPHLSITVTAHNGEDAAAAVDFALAHDLLFNLNFYRENDATATQGDLRAEDTQMIASMRRCFAMIEQNLPAHSILGSLVDRANFGIPHEQVCGVGDSYMVVDQQGKVARCQMEIERAVSDIWAMDPLADIKHYDQDFQSLAVGEKEGCQTCAWRYWCAGGCPALTYRVTGRNDVKSPYCHVYQTIYPDLLRLEGLRLLKKLSANQPSAFGQN